VDLGRPLALKLKSPIHLVSTSFNNAVQSFGGVNFFLAIDALLLQFTLKFEALTFVGLFNSFDFVDDFPFELVRN
jgi:hypothetical protein